MARLEDQANRFLAGEELAFDEVDALWQALKRTGELSLARAVLERLRDGEGLLDGLPKSPKDKERLCQQEALLISKDPEINSAVRHGLALETLGEEFELDDPGLDGDAETLGIAGGILKRRWQELGQLGDLKQAAEYYRRGAVGDDLGDDAYAHINAAFLEDLLAEAGDEPDERRRRASDLRKRILRDLPWPSAPPKPNRFLSNPDNNLLSLPFLKALCLNRARSPLPRSPSSLFVKVNAPIRPTGSIADLCAGLVLNFAP